MGFFDLNVSYVERDGGTAAASQEASLSDAKARRLRLVVKAMELGYAGVAYNRTVRGVISDADRCRNPQLPLPSLLKAAPALYAASRFHRKLLGVSLSSPFRQYTRLTVAIDSATAVAALHPGNAVLRTYHLVAVRPMSQAAFDQACKVSEVDLISIDFSKKLRFRLKLAMVKEAIERGVYFEITYSHLISDFTTRRQILSDAKLLADWTGGKNLIFSSGASNVNGIRGPYDVINLQYLLGVSMERAKLTISKNCRSLLNSSLRRKQCYEEATRMEKIFPSQSLDMEDTYVLDGDRWDPISSGKGDLPAVDDIAKFSAVSEQISKNYSDAVSDVVLFDRMSESKGGMVLLDDNDLLFPLTKKDEQPIEAYEVPYCDEASAVEDHLLPMTSFEHQSPVKECTVCPPVSDKVFPANENNGPYVSENDGPYPLSRLVVDCAADGVPLSCNLPNICNHVEDVVQMPLNDETKIPILEYPVSFDVHVSQIKNSVGCCSVPNAPDAGVPHSDSERSVDKLAKVVPLLPTKNVGDISGLLNSDDTPEIQDLAIADKLNNDPYASVNDTPFRKCWEKSGTSLYATRLNRASDAKVPNRRDATSDTDGREDNLASMGQDVETSVSSICSQQRHLKLGKVKCRQKSRDRGLPLLSRHLLCHLAFKKVRRLRGSRKSPVRMGHVKNV